MFSTFLISISITPFVLHQIWANSTVAALQVTANATSDPPKQTSYFYQEPQGIGTYEFGYHIEDKPTKNIQFRNETRFSNGTVTGSYGFLRPDGIFTLINYLADQNGYRTKKKKINKIDLLSSSTESLETTTTTTEIPGLNLTSGTLPSLLVDKVMDEFQIDLSPDASPGDILHPNISDIINGKVPLSADEKNSSSQLGFDVVQNFIPSNFPIIPFQLPTTEMPSSKRVDD